MPACVDSSTYTFPCPATYTGDYACSGNGWSCTDWVGFSCGEGTEAAAFAARIGADTPAANIAALLRECQSSCHSSTCTSPSRCTDAACLNFKYELVQKNAECSTGDTKMGTFNDAEP